jgi:fatty acyl-CoA reductase
MSHIQDYYAGKTLLITGATGLVGKVLVEKLLRELPQVRRIYVLIRPKTLPNGSELSPQDRFAQEILASPAFERLRKRQGAAFDAFIQAKVTAIGGDLAEERLGLPGDVYRRLQQEVQVVINSAAVVSFDAPLDQALLMNTLGTRRVLAFVKGASDAFYAHISTCYVNGTREGPVPEEPFHPTLTVGQINGKRQAPFDVDREIHAIQERVSTIRARVSPASASAAVPSDQQNGRAKTANEAAAQRLEGRLVREGFRWAQRRGWNDVYTFTKAMAEQVLVRHRGDVPVLVLRPSIIESALSEPEPGWLDGFRMLDPLIVAYGRERLPDFPGNPNGILDVVPVDVVVNALLAAIPWAHAKGGLQVCQVATGMENPLMLAQFAKLVQEHFRRRPLSGRTNRPLRLPDMTFPSTKSYLRRLYLRQRLPLAIGGALAKLIPSAAPRRRALRSLAVRRSALDRLAMYARLYGPYAEVRCQYLTHNLREVWDSLSPEEQAQFNFNMRSIDWANYIQEVHIGGIRRFLLGLSSDTADQPVRAAPVTQERPAQLSRNGQDNDPEGADGSLASGGGPGAVVRDGSPRSTASASGGAPGGPAASMVAARRGAGLLVLPAPAPEVDRWVRASPMARLSQSLFRLWLDVSYHVYLGFRVSGLEHVPTKGPFIVVSNHTSHLDTCAILVALKRQNRDLHPLAAKDYFFKDRLMSWASHMFLNAVPFDRLTHVAESLGLAAGVLQRGHSVIYFPEGSRSVSGVMQPFRRGVGVLAVVSGVPVVPAYITGTYESMSKGRSWPRRSHVRIRFGPPIRCEQNVEAEAASDVARQMMLQVQQAVASLSPAPTNAPPPPPPA